MDDTLRCYKVLDLEPGASAERVRRSYIELAHVWDPARYDDNPVLRTRAEEKRKEIDEAYEALRVFLPDLQSPPVPTESNPDPERDFNELATHPSGDTSRAVMGILVGISLLLLFIWAFYVLSKGRDIAPTTAALTAPVE